MDIQLTDFCMIKHCCFNSITLGISPASTYCSGYPFSFHDYMRHKDKLITVPLCILKQGRGGRVGRGGDLGSGEDRGKQIASNLTEKMMVLHENMQNRAF